MDRQGETAGSVLYYNNNRRLMSPTTGGDDDNDDASLLTNKEGFLSLGEVKELHTCITKYSLHHS